jgi:hypothetical protein
VESSFEFGIQPSGSVQFHIISYNTGILHLENEGASSPASYVMSNKLPSFILIAPVVKGR